MSTHENKTPENKSRAIANDSDKKQTVRDSVFTDNRPEAIAQRNLAEMISNSVPPLQRMKVRTVDKAATVSGPTAAKHISATRSTTATNGFGDRTFVAGTADLTGPVNASDHDFTEEYRTASPRFTINSDVTVYQYNKRAREDGVIELGAGKPVDLTINGEARSCEIGAHKNGFDAVVVDHFKLN